MVRVCSNMFSPDFTIVLTFLQLTSVQLCRLSNLNGQVLQETKPLGRSRDSRILIAPFHGDTDRHFNMDGKPRPLIRL